jgi:hypothetical protein
MRNESKTLRATHVGRIGLSVAFAIGVAPLLSGNLWLDVWQGSRAQPWDGTGHYALAQAYNQSIFPETFGWTNGYLAGIGFPNFYAPLSHFPISPILKYFQA